MALALYRKYRPGRFADVVGQEHVTEPLRTALAAGRINHAYLFSGPRGCGKTSSARILARSLNCVDGPTPDPCGVCPSCVALAPEGPGNVDVIELDAASHGRVDDTRELRDRAFYTPAESRYRVLIIDEAHMVSKEGFNALLKIVEEPPDHLIFIFATTEPEKVLPTIRSRTHHYPFRLIPPGTMRGLLERICAEEGATVAPAVFPLVLRAGGGSARDSLSVLDQLLAGAGPEGVVYERAVALLGVTDVALIDDVVDALAAGDRATVFETVDRLVEAGLDPRRFAADLLQRLRDLTLLQAIPDAAERGLIDVGGDELERMAEQAARLGPATLVRHGEILHAGLVEMRGATAPRLLLELMCARMLLPAASTDEPAVLERLERLERRAAVAPAPVPHGETAAAPPPEPGATESGAARRTFLRVSRTPAGSPAEPAVREASAPPVPPDASPASASPVPSDAPAAAAAPPPAPSDRREDGPPASARPATPLEAGPAAPGRAASPATGPADRDEPAPPATNPSRRPPPDHPGPHRPVPEQPDAGRVLPTHPPRPPDDRRPADRLAADRPAADRPGDRPPAGAPRGEPAPERRPVSPAPAAAPQAEPAPAPPPPVPVPVDAAAVRRVWPEVLAVARQQSRSTGAMLVNATVRAVEEDVLVLSIASEPLARRLSETRNTDVVADALHAVLGVRWRVRCDHGDAAPPAPARSATARPARPANPPQRPSRPAPQRPARRPAPDDGTPLPPEPPDDDAPPEDEEEMLAELAQGASSPPSATAPVAAPAARGPEETAIELLTAHLGAKAIDRR